VSLQTAFTASLMDRFKCLDAGGSARKSASPLFKGEFKTLSRQPIVFTSNFVSSEIIPSTPSSAARSI